MSARLHLAHPHIAERVTGLVDRALHRHSDTDLYQRPAYPPGWDWVTPDEWMAAHGRKENSDA